MLAQVHSSSGITSRDSSETEVCHLNNISVDWSVEPIELRIAIQSKAVPFRESNPWTINTVKSISTRAPTTQLLLLTGTFLLLALNSRPFILLKSLPFGRVNPKFT